jgi:D-alanyl-D-alanine carboxypeptidase/D-alanyl-D-alanine-endopeptidase (penicillin-binding protein 4)
MAVLALALLSAFTIAAGVAVARMLPPRLALLALPSVSQHALARPGLVLVPASGQPSAGAGATAAGIRSALARLTGSAVLGPRVGVEVTSLSTGSVLYRRNARTAFTPASTTKIATAVAALSRLGPAARFTTRVVAGRRPGSVVLVGGGDPTLADGRPPASDYPQPATLATLAARTAAALLTAGVHGVRLRYDASLYAGAGLAPGWPERYVTGGNVSPISSLEVDQGRHTTAGRPQDADDPGNFRPRSQDPAAQAAAAFAGQLRRHGIAVHGPARPAAAPSGQQVLAAVSSPPLAQVVQWMLTESNNVIAENLARQVAIAAGRPATFGGAAQAVIATDRRLGVTGIRLVDGSGLSPLDLITPAALVRLVSLAASPASVGLRPVLTGMPVAGFSGTLAPGDAGFGASGRPALGVVRAKTGNLSTVATLAGVVYARNGQLLAFAVMADRVHASGLLAAEAELTGVGAALAGCGCP